MNINKLKNKAQLRFVILVLFFIGNIGSCIGQTSKNLDFRYAFCLLQKPQKGGVLEKLQQYKYQYIDTLNLHNCGKKETPWLKGAELDTILCSIKTIKGIKFLSITFYGCHGDTAFSHLLQALPPVEYAEINLIEGYPTIKGGSRTFSCDECLAIDIRKKAIIRGYYCVDSIKKMNKWGGFLFPKLDTLVLVPLYSPSLHPFFGYGMDSLKVLRLEYVESSSFTGFPESIGLLTNLIEFNYEGTDLNGAPLVPKSFGNLQKLEKLILNGFGGQFPNSVSKLKNLKQLVLLGEFNKINSNFFQLEQLDSFIFGSYKIKKIPLIGRLKNLRYLTLWSLNRIPKNIGNLKKLKSFRLLNNYQFSPLPKSIYDLKNLDTLELEIYNIKKLSEDFGQLTNLKKLIIRSSVLKKLPASFINLTNLNELILTTHKIKKIPESILKLKNLKRVRLNNKIIK